jgi:hypothetical protein
MTRRYKLTTHDLAQRAGGSIGKQLLEKITGTSKGAEDMEQFHKALLDLMDLPHPDSAAVGFVIALDDLIDSAKGIRRGTL